MNKINKQCNNLLKQLDNFPNSYYSIKRIKQKVLEIKTNNLANATASHLNLKDYIRHFVDETGDYDNDIIIELEKLNQLLEK